MRSSTYLVFFFVSLCSNLVQFRAVWHNKGLAATLFSTFMLVIGFCVNISHLLPLPCFIIEGFLKCGGLCGASAHTVWVVWFAELQRCYRGAFDDVNPALRASEGFPLESTNGTGVAKSISFFIPNALFADCHCIQHKCLMMAEGEACWNVTLRQNLKKTDHMFFFKVCY